VARLKKKAKQVQMVQFLFKMHRLELRMALSLELKKEMALFPFDSRLLGLTNLIAIASE